MSRKKQRRKNQYARFRRSDYIYVSTRSTGRGETYARHVYPGLSALLSALAQSPDVLPSGESKSSREVRMGSLCLCPAGKHRMDTRISVFL